MQSAIAVDKVSKLYRLGAHNASRYRTLRETLVGAIAQQWQRVRSAARSERLPGENELWALKDVSLEIQPGEVVGVVGRNGAGKSTLLKILSRITEPTSGRVQLRGRVGSLLEIGTGFHPELTGRENIFMNGSILGMARGEIARKFDDIVCFAEMERFLDTPVKRYSSGMYVRLAFAVAAHLDLEILLVDEVLAVGDMEFQRKCLNSMGAIASGGRTVLFVSHNLGVIHRLCPRTLLMRGGQVQMFGPTTVAIQKYLSDNLEHRGEWKRPDSDSPRRDVVLQRARILTEQGALASRVNCDEPFSVAIDYQVVNTVPNFEVGINIRNGDGIVIFTSLDSDTADWSDSTRPAGMYCSTCRVPAHLLAPGTYSLTFAAHIVNQETFETQRDALTFEVAETGCIRFKRNDRRAGVIVPTLAWTINRRNRAANAASGIEW